MLWYMLSLRVHLSEVYRNDWMNQACFFLFFTYPTLCCKEMWVFPKIRVLPSGTAPNSVHLKRVF